MTIFTVFEVCKIPLSFEPLRILTLESTSLSPTPSLYVSHHTAIVTFLVCLSVGLKDQIHVLVVRCGSLSPDSVLRCEMMTLGSNTLPRVPMSVSQEGVGIDSIMIPVISSP